MLAMDSRRSGGNSSSQQKTRNRSGAKRAASQNECVGMFLMCTLVPQQPSLVHFLQDPPVFVSWASAVHSRCHVVDGVITFDFVSCLESTSSVCCPPQAYASLLGFQAGQDHILQFSCVCCPQQVSCCGPGL